MLYQTKQTTKHLSGEPNSQHELAAEYVLAKRLHPLSVDCGKQPGPKHTHSLTTLNTAFTGVLLVLKQFNRRLQSWFGRSAVAYVIFVESDKKLFIFYIVNSVRSADM